MAIASNNFIQMAANVNKNFELNENNPIIQDIAEAGTDLIEELGAEKIPEEQRPSWEEVRQAAITVLVTANAIKNNQQLQTSHIQKMVHSLSKQNNANKLIELDYAVWNIKNADLQNSTRYRELMSTVLNLQNQVNLILGQKIKLIFAYAGEDGTVTLYEHDRNTIDYWGSRGKILNSMGQSLKDADTSRVLENKNLDKLDATYKEVYSRAQYAKSKIKSINEKTSEKMKKEGKSKEEIKKNLDFAFYLLWKNGGKWMRYRVGSQGIILEAYFNFFIHKDNAFQLVEPAVGRYILVGMANVDNTSGFLEGDVSVGSIQYAVKGLNASAMSYYEIVTQYATNIALISDEAIGIEYLNWLKNDLKSSAPLLKQVTARNINKTVNGLLTQVGREASKNYGGSWNSYLNE